MKLTPANIGKAAGFAIGAAVLTVGGFKAGRSSPAEASSAPSPATISAPPLTSADIVDLRRTMTQLDKHLDGVDDKLDRFNTRLSWLEGATSGATGASRAR